MNYQPHRQVVKRGANHGLHLVLTILTCGMWAFTGWPIAAIMGRKKTVTSHAPQQIYPPQQPNQWWQPPRQ